jgi:hypothetical protein
MKGDYYRYLAEFLSNEKYNLKFSILSESLKKASDNALRFYQQAMDAAEKDLTATNAIRLGTHLKILFEKT